MGWDYKWRLENEALPKIQALEERLQENRRALRDLLVILEIQILPGTKGKVEKALRELLWDYESRLKEL